MSAKSETARTLGRYRLIAVIGQGGMARVYLAVSRGPAGFNKLLVVKELSPDLAEDPEFLAMFLDEARLAARLNHPNVVQTYEVGQDGSSHFIAMEYLEGQSLNGLLRHTQPEGLKTAIHLKILSTALLGLHYAHELTDFDGTPLDVVHRDVSPQNVFVTYDGQVKIVDFGIAKALGAMAKTRAGTIKGKLRYMAPEQAIAQPIDRRADIFSFGVMLWEALTGQRFAYGKTDVEIVHQRATGTEPRVRDVKPDVSPALAEICDRAMAVSPDDRFASAAELHQALEDATETTFGRVTTDQIGKVVRDTFADERAKLRKLVDAQIKLADSVPSTDFSALPMIDIGEATLRSDDFGATPNRDARTPRGDNDSLQGTAPASALTGSAPVQPARPKWIYLGLAVVLVGLIGLGATQVWSRDRDSPRPGTTTSVAATAPPSATAEPAATTIELDVSATPEGAQLELDGAPLASNPFRARLKKDAELHRVRASLAGYAATERVVAFDRDVALKLELVQSPSEDAQAKPATAARAAPPSGRQPAAGEPVKPGSGKKPRVIDEKDPYGK